MFRIKATPLVWHFRLGHPSFEVVNRVVQKNKLLVSPLNSNKHALCSSCQLGKSKKLPFHHSTRISESLLQLIHSDLWTSPVPSMSGYKYYALFVDDYSRYSWIYPLYTKAETFDAFVKFKALVENQFSTKIKQLQSDGGGEYMSNQFQAFLLHHGIVFRKSCPYSFPQNGLAECKLRHILETGLTLLAHAYLFNKYWVDSFLTAIYTINRLPTATLHNVSPYEKLYHKSPDYQRLRVFGCLCYPLLRPHGFHKLEYRSKSCIFLGYQYAGYKCLDPVTNKAYLSRHVVFDETSFPAMDHATSLFPSQLAAQGNSSVSFPLFSLPLTTPDFAPASLQPSVPLEPTLDLPTSPQPPAAPSLPSDTSSAPDPTSLDYATAPLPAVFPADPLPSSINAPTSMPPEPIFDSAPIPPTDQQLPAIPLPTMTTRSHTGSLKPKQFPGFKLFRSKYPFLSFHSVLPESEPTSYSKAALDPRWKAAMSAEFEALLSNGTWTLCPRPPHCHVIHNKWVYKIKRHVDGSIERFKARLAAKGFEQQFGVDYTETFSSVIKPATIRLILALAVHFDWPIRQLDISNAFLHGSLNEEVYMEQPRGFVSSHHPTFVCKLNKAIYGLKQAPRAWYTRLSNFLLDLGFIVSLVDTFLFTFVTTGIKLFLLIYVDDIIVTGTHLHLIRGLISRLQQEFPAKDLGPLSYFLGIQVTRTPASLHLCQSKYVTDLLLHTHMAEAKSASSPYALGSKLSRYDGEDLLDVTEYRSVVGSLQYCTLTRSDIAYSVNQLCQHLHHPTSTHWTAVKQVLQFLKGSIDHGLTYSKTPLQLNAFYDSDWVGSPDDCRSTSGFPVFLGNCLISWSAKKQPVVS